MAANSLIVPLFISVLAIILGTSLDRYVDNIIETYVPSVKAGLLWQTLYIIGLIIFIVILALIFLPKLDKYVSPDKVVVVPIDSDTPTNINK